MNKRALVSAVVSIVLVSSFAQAQVVTWGPATDVGLAVGNSSDVSTNGTFVEAFNGVPSNLLETTPAITVNTVVFTPTASLFSPNNNTGANDLDVSLDTNAGDADYDAILSVPNFGGGTDPTTITLGGTGGLVAGNNYEIQIWYVDDRVNQEARETPYSDSSGNTVILNDQFSIGTFTATGPTIDITVESPDFGQAHINAYQIRDLTVGGGLLGDVDQNGVVDFFDIQPFINLLSNQTFQFEGDIDGNGDVDFFDIQPFINILAGGSASSGGAGGAGGGGVF